MGSSPMMVQEVEDVDAFEDPDDVDREEVGVKDARHTGSCTAGPKMMPTPR